ncbi:unnamed protein product [Rotaria sordida]|uniref:Uncharacterized protein n=1 Tax=Rotaria sordida TaxID=392033 RepID=A0A818RP65_9BILA|nr:unnamed protein product [Rotaria sordida]CAF0996652.1 unnamed protein product [Rotaria sordida]CAF1100861.1 unnamed protein product [Rotaria sordida]CAF3661050.1 unnamed protein product [Rotaria sordida]
MINAITRHDDRHVSSNRQSSSDDISSVSSENLLPVDKSNQQPKIKRDTIRVSRIKINDLNNQQNLRIKYLYRPKDNIENLLNAKKKFTINEHIKVTYVKYPSADDSNTKIPVLRSNSNSRQKYTDHVNDSHPNNKIPQNINGNLVNRTTRKMTSRQSAVHGNRTPTAAHINQGSNQKIIASKPMNTQQPTQMNQKTLYTSVKHVSDKVKKL